MKLIYNKIFKWTVIISVLAIAATSHAYNMFNFPYYEADEGTYMSQAWAVANTGELAPYTYWYDHAPVGWFLIALWLKLTGGVDTFGYAINSGRVLMLILHVLSTAMLLYIGKQLTKSYIPGALAGILFSLSPLALYFQRRVLLDNIMVFWILITFCLVLFYENTKKLRYIVLSAITLAIAILSKESAVFFIPFFLGLIIYYTDARHRIFAVGKWILSLGMVVSLYFLYALLKGEFFPSGTLLGGNNEHVSLLSTLQFQASRGNTSILDSGSSYWSMLQTWIKDDPLIIYVGAIATFMALLLGIKNKIGLIIGSFALSYWAFLMRGGLVLEFYIIPLIPVVSLAIGYVAWRIYSLAVTYFKPAPLKIFASIPVIAVVFVFLHMLLISSNQVRGYYNIYSSNQTKAQIAATHWILSQHKPYAFYDIDNFAYLDLNLKNNNNFKNAEYYWKSNWDKEIKTDVLNNNYNNIDYIVFTPLIGGDIGAGHLPLTGKAIENANPITSFDGDGWYVQIWGVKNSKRILNSAWESYKKRFIVTGEQVTDPGQNITTSEGQSYALLQAVYMNDRASFDRVYGWTKKTLQQPDNTFAWKYENGKVVDKGNATDADQDIALALLFASKQWKETSYRDEALKIIQAIWQYNIATVNNRSYLMPGKWGNQSSEIVINPSYLSPAHYRIFAEVDRKHNWKAVVDTSYVVLTQCTEAKLDKSQGVLPPEWCAIDKATNTAKQPQDPQPKASEYGYNAFRTPWRIAVDYQWNKDPRARKYLKSLQFLGTEYRNTGKLAAVYTHDGKVWEEYETVSAYGGDIGYFVVMDPKIATKIYKEKIEKKFYEDADKSYWEDANNYYTQNWGWFGTALATDAFTNLWKK